MEFYQIISYVLMTISIVATITCCIVEGRSERNDLHSQ